MEQVRSFVAIELNQEIREKLGEVQALLQSRGIADQVRWVKPGGVHLTLKFLGNVPVPRVKELVVAVKQASEGIGPFVLDFGGLGCFPNPRRPSVIWVGVQGDTEVLAHLQGRVEERLAVLGFPPEKRAYTPHLTLGRVRRRTARRERSRLGELLQKQEVETLADMAVREVALMKSVLSPAGARYSQLAVVELEG